MICKRIPKIKCKCLNSGLCYVSVNKFRPVEYPIGTSSVQLCNTMCNFQ